MIINMDWHLPPAKHIVRSLAHAAPSLSVPWLSGPDDHDDDDEEEEGGDQHGADDEERDDDEIPEQLVVDDNGVDEVEGKEPEEEAGDPASQLRMIFLMFRKNISLMMMRLTCNSSREVAV